MNSPKLGLPLMVSTDTDKPTTHNNAVALLDVLLHLTVLDKDTGTPPGSPANGDAYIVGSSPSGAWTGQQNNIAWYNGTAWQFAVPRAGWIAWVSDEAVRYHWNGSAWVTGPS